MADVRELLTVFAETGQAVDTTIGQEVTVRGGAAGIRVTVELDADAQFGYINTPPGGSAEANISLFAEGDQILADTVRTFTLGARAGQKLDFQYTGIVGPLKVKQLLVEEVQGGVV